MPQSLKSIKDRIKSISNTQKVTNAMQMVSASKLNKIEKTLYPLRTYCQRLEEIFDKIIATPRLKQHSLLNKKEAVKNIGLIVVTSDNGLCGFYNNNVINSAASFIEQNKGKNVSLILVGKKGINYFKSQNFSITESHTGLSGQYQTACCDKITALIIKLFLDERMDEVYCAHMHFINAIQQKPSIEKMLPVDTKEKKQEEYIVEPDADSLLEECIIQMISMKMRRIFIESFTCEHASRVVAMKAATDNAKELVERLTIARNKIRQSIITQEIMEIISSSEALKG